MPFKKEIFMKKILFVMVLSAIGIFMPNKPLVYAQPTINKPNSFVIDTNSVRGDLEDNIRIHNQTSKTGISFTVYVYNEKKKTWIEYGTGSLKGPGDTEFISSKLSGDLDDYRYFAIQALDKNSYRYTFEKKRNDLYIYIYDNNVKKASDKKDDDKTIMQKYSKK
jgi:hypothetical protein